GDLDRAIERAREGVALVERTGGTRGSDYPMLLSYLQTLYQVRGDLAASLDVTRRLTRLDEEMGRTGTVDYLHSSATEANILMAWGESRAAQVVVDRLLPKWSATADGEPPPWFDVIRGQLLWWFDDGPGGQRLLASAVERARAQGNVDLALTGEFALARVLLT